MLKILAGFVLLAVGALAQGEYVIVRASSPSSAAEVVTVQQPATSAYKLNFVGAYFYCSVACEVTLERNGTAATATSSTPTPINSSYQAAKASGFYGSDVGTGTVIGKYTLAAGGSQVLDLAAIHITAQGTTNNLTLRTSSITGDVKIMIQFREDKP